MDRTTAAERFRLAELELQLAQLALDGTLVANERYRAALSELAIAEAVVLALLGTC